MLGWLLLWRAQKSLALVSLIIVGAISCFVVLYNTFDAIVYMTIALPLLALWLAEGLARVTAWVSVRSRFAPALIVLLPLLQLALYAGEIDLHHDYAAVDWIDRVLAQAPAQAVIVTHADAHTFALWYAHDVLYKRADVVVVDRDLWSSAESYRQIVLRNLHVDSAEDSLEHAIEQSGRSFFEADDLIRRNKP